MKSNLTTLALTLFALIFPTATGFAQSGDQVAMRLDVVGWGDAISGLTLRGTGGAPFTAQAFRYSKAQAYSGPAMLEIYQDPAEAAPSAPPSAEEVAKFPAALKELLERRKKTPNLVALAVLPTGSKRATVLMLPAPGGTFLTHVMDDDPSKLPIGQLRVHNLSPYPLAIRFNGKDAYKLAIHGSCVVAPVNQEIVYELTYQQDDEWKPLENNLLAVADNEQSQMVVLKSDASYFSSSNGSRTGFLQLVTLRRSQRESEVVELTKAERAAAAKEAKRLNDEMDEAAKPEAERKKAPKPKVPTKSSKSGKR